MSDIKKYWFRAKRYGWGWGLPCAWQGWAVLFGWLAVFFAGARLLVPHRAHALPFWGFVVLMTAAFLLVCYIKGEPLRWRWRE